MLYPDFDDLVALKDLKLDLMQASSRLSHSTVLGGHHSPFRGQGLEFDSVRKYVPGDDIRHIDWRVTARTNSPHLKIFREERERNVLLCVDMNATMRFGTKKTFKSVQAAHIAALLGWKGMANHDRISACLFGDVPNGIEFFSPTRTKRSFSVMLKRLAKPAIEKHHISLDNVLQHLDKAAHTGSLIYFISDFMTITQDFQQNVNVNRLVKRCDVVFIAINDRADQSIFPVGNLGFNNMLNEKIYIDTHNELGRQTYEKQWQANRKILYEMTSRFKIPLIELTTESDLKKDFALGLRSLSKRKKR
jgi:uncharacterized protein (DUF58 family)